MCLNRLVAPFPVRRQRVTRRDAGIRDKRVLRRQTGTNTSLAVDLVGRSPVAAMQFAGTR